MPTGFRIPDFNIACNIWHQPNAPPAAPDIPNLACQLRAPFRESAGEFFSGFTPSLGGEIGAMALLVSARVDVRDGYNATGFDTVEAPAGSGRFYTVMIVDDVARGFANEYRYALLAKVAPWPTPIP